LGGIALAKAVKVDLLPYGSLEPFASGQAVLNYAKGADNTEVQVNCWDLTPGTEYTVYLRDGGWYSIGTFVTRRNGSGNLHVRLPGDVSGNLSVAVNNTVLNATVLIYPPPGKTRCFLPDTPVWVDGALVPISKVAAGGTVGKVRCLGQIEKLEEHEGRWEYREITLESGNSTSVVDAHRFMLDSGQWVAAQNLRSGMKLKSLSGAVTIKSVVTRTMPCVGKVYNIKVSDSDKYLVGKEGVVVRDY
jgi:hypothetical protein